MKITEKDVKNAEEFAASVLNGDCSGHDLEHIKRVMSCARLIIKSDNITDIDENLTLLCCALHDVDDHKFKCEGEDEYANLKKFCVAFGYADDVFNAAKNIIDKISFTDNPTFDASLSIEAKVAQDADRLDALGAVGIARAFAYGGSRGRGFYGENSTVSHFYDKLFKLPELMNTKAGRAIADERVKYMREFIDRLNAEALFDKKS